MPITAKDESGLYVERSNWYVTLTVLVGLLAGAIAIVIGVVILNGIKQIVVIAFGSVLVVIALFFVKDAVGDRFVFKRGLFALTLEREYTYPLCTCCCWYRYAHWPLDRDGHAVVSQAGMDADVFIATQDPRAPHVNLTEGEGFFGCCGPDKSQFRFDVQEWLRTFGRSGRRSSGDQRRASRQQQQQQQQQMAVKHQHIDV